MPHPPVVKAQNVYCDTQSIERGKAKLKFKLAGYPIPLEGVTPKRLFWVLTSNPNTYPKKRTVIIEQSHWENRDVNALKEPRGYLCPDHTDVMTHAEIRAKRRAKRNGFKYSARLCDDKFAELLEMIKKLKLSATFTVNEWKRIASAATGPAEIDKILKELHLQ